jgi:hypothetical protein
VAMTRILHKEMAPFTLPGGEPGFALLPVVSEAMPAALQEGLTRHRAVALEGRCPCGARRPTPTRAQVRVMHRQQPTVPLKIHHRQDCPAHDDVLGPAVDAWQRGED